MRHWTRTSIVLSRTMGIVARGTRANDAPVAQASLSTSVNKMPSNNSRAAIYLGSLALVSPRNSSGNTSEKSRRPSPHVPHQRCPHPRAGFPLVAAGEEQGARFFTSYRASRARLRRTSGSKPRPRIFGHISLPKSMDRMSHISRGDEAKKGFDRSLFFSPRPVPRAARE